MILQQYRSSLDLLLTFLSSFPCHPCESACVPLIAVLVESSVQVAVLYRSDGRIELCNR